MPGPIVLFDGVCMFCHASVNFIIDLLYEIIDPRVRLTQVAA